MPSPGTSCATTGVARGLFPISRLMPRFEEIGTKSPATTALRNVVGEMATAALKSRVPTTPSRRRPGSSPRVRHHNQSGTSAAKIKTFERTSAARPSSTPHSTAPLIDGARRKASIARKKPRRSGINSVSA